MSDNDSTGAIDNEFDDALTDFDADTNAELTDGERTFRPETRPEVAIDLVTRQPLLVLSERAPSVVAYYEETGFNLLTYKGHPYLPVRRGDVVFECVFIPQHAKDVHTKKKTYSFPRGRLMRVPLEQAGENGQ